MKDVSLSESGGNGTFASFDRLFVELSPETLTSFNPVIKQIRLTKPEVHIVRNQERVFNIADMVSYFSQTEEKKEDTGKTLFSINNIQIENGTIRADDEARDKHLLIDDLNISLPFIGNMPTDVDIFVNFGITARINKDKIELIGKSKPSRDQRRQKLVSNWSGSIFRHIWDTCRSIRVSNSKAGNFRPIWILFLPKGKGINALFMSKEV